MAFWIALAVWLLGTVGGLAYAVLRGFQLWRDAKRSSGTLGTAMARITDASGRIERQIAAAEAAAGRLRSATERLSTSRAQLHVQLGALRQASSQVRRALWFVPGI